MFRNKSEQCNPKPSGIICSETSRKNIFQDLSNEGVSKYVGWRRVKRHIGITCSGIPRQICSGWERSKTWPCHGGLFRVVIFKLSVNICFKIVRGNPFQHFLVNRSYISWDNASKHFGEYLLWQLQRCITLVCRISACSNLLKSTG